MSQSDGLTTKFHDLMQQQLYNEFTTAHQYTAVAVYCDGADLPRLAKFFYGQAVEERNHAMMFVQYLLDRGVPAEIPATGAVRSRFDAPRDAVALMLEQERAVTDQIAGLADAARDEGDHLGAQFTQWFLRQQVEEVATMTRLLHVAERAGDNMFELENFVARELDSPSGPEPDAPRIAGGALTHAVPPAR